MSLREFFACAEAHQEYHGDGKPKPEPMTREQLEAIGIGETTVITNFKAGK